MLAELLIGIVISLSYVAGLKLGEIAEEELRWFKWKELASNLIWLVLIASGVLLALFQRAEVALGLLALVIITASLSARKLKLNNLKPLIVFWVSYCLIFSFNLLNRIPI